MSTYLEQVNKRIDIDKRKLASLEEYKQNLLAKEGQIDKSSFLERIAQIEEEFLRLQKSLRANSKMKAHYDAAYKHLLDLRLLDSRIQNTTDPTMKSEIEQEIINHTTKLQKHLTSLPEDLVTELQQNYLADTKNQPLTEVKNAENEKGIQAETKTPTETISEDESSEPVVIDTMEQKTDTPSNDVKDDDFSNANQIFSELLQIFDDEKSEMSEVGAFDTAEELEAFLDKYKNLKMECHARLVNAINANLDLNSESEHANKTNNVEEIKMEEYPQIPVTGESPIIIMLDLVDQLEVTKKPIEKANPINIKVSANFKEELKDGNWSYNVIHFTAELISVTEENEPSFIEKLSKITINQERITILRERINNLSPMNLAKVYNEYYANNSTARLTTALKVLLGEAISKLA